MFKEESYKFKATYFSGTDTCFDPQVIDFSFNIMYVIETNQFMQRYVNFVFLYQKTSNKNTNLQVLIVMKNPLCI